MPHRLECDPYSNSPPSPASSDTSVSSNTHATPPRGPQRDFIHPRPVQSLPPLRAFLRNEGIDTDIEPPQQCLVRATHEVAREEARRRAIRAAPTRFSPLLGYESRNAPSLAEHRTIQPLDEVYMPGYNRRKSLDDQCHRHLLQVGMTVMRERHSHPYGHVDPESARSRSVCLGKWKRSRRRRRCLPRLLLEMKLSLQFFRLESDLVLRTLMNSQMTRTRSVMVACVCVPVMFPEQERTSPQSKVIRTTMGCQIPKHRRRQAMRRSEGTHHHVQKESLPVSQGRRKAWKRALSANISHQLESSSRSSSSPSSTIQGSGSSMSSNAPMGVGHHGAAHGKP
ncbi:hypothetical protein V8E52_000422 [Russula decolorans]